MRVVISRYEISLCTCTTQSPQHLAWTPSHSSHLRPRGRPRKATLGRQALSLTHRLLIASLTNNTTSPTVGIVISVAVVLLPKSLLTIFACLWDRCFVHGINK